VAAPSYKVLVARRMAPALAEVHPAWTDIWYVISGGGVVVTGGSLIEATAQRAGELRGRAVAGGEEHHIATGDLIAIPAGVPHWVRSITGNEIVCLVVRARSAGDSVLPAEGATVEFFSATQLDSAAHRTPENGPSLTGVDLDTHPSYSNGLARRTAPGRADVHTSWTDVWYIIAGGGVLVTGGSLINAQERRPGEIRGSGIVGGEERHVAAGDVIVIPAGVPHWLRSIDEKEIVYLDPKVASPSR